LFSTTLCVTNVVASAAGYTYTRIAVPGAIATLPVALNASGEVIGSWADTGHISHGFIYSKGKITSFDPPGSQTTLPAGINASGEIVGIYLNSSFEELGFTYSKGTFTDVAFPNAVATTLAGVDDNGVLLGSAMVSGIQVVFTDAKGKFATVARANFPSPTGINASGSVVGFYESSFKSFLSVGGVLKTIPIPDVKSAVAYGINNGNNVVGSITANNDKQKSFVYQKGVLKTFDVPGWTSSFAAAVNNKGVVVGNVSNLRGQSSGYVYNGTSFSFVAIPKATSQGALKINDAGQILGSYTDSTNTKVAFLATPKS